MSEFLVRAVWRRAGGICEYCRIPQAFFPIPFEIDHIISQQHGGPTELFNLALACLHCNSHKGPNIAGLDPRTRRLTRLFNPRRHKWERHFRWDGPLLRGRTAIGRTTVLVLAINGPYLVELREELLQEGLLPPT
jgi:hypothetical protein